MKYYILGNKIYIKDANITADTIYKDGLLDAFADGPRFIETFTVYSKKINAQKAASKDTVKSSLFHQPVIEVEIDKEQVKNNAAPFSAMQIVRASLEHADKKRFKAWIELDHNDFKLKAQDLIVKGKDRYNKAKKYLEEKSLKRQDEISTWKKGEVFNPSNTRKIRLMLAAAFSIPALLFFGITFTAITLSTLSITLALILPVKRRDQNAQNQAFIKNAFAKLDSPAPENNSLTDAFEFQLHFRDVEEGVVWQWQAKKLKQALEKPQADRQKYLKNIEDKARIKYNRQLVICLG